MVPGPVGLAPLNDATAVRCARSDGRRKIALVVTIIGRHIDKIERCQVAACGANVSDKGQVFYDMFGVWLREWVRDEARKFSVSEDVEYFYP